MNLAQLSSRFELSRRNSLLVFGGTLLALVVAATWFVSARSGLADAYAEVGTRGQLLAEAKVRELEAELRVEYADSARRLLAASQARGMQPEAWGERLINVKQGQLPREDVATLLASIARGDGRIFGAQAFDLSVTRAEEGLFDVPEETGREPAPLSLSLGGTMLFRTQQGGGTPAALAAGLEGAR
ncbi:hypothetical protein H0E84_03430 [Luteimonas sp. SJ-92]|uniref:Uncharacterized protein n=1 Tax=Luteimonas salinisoli TaxID=2752307 RepID=A0A853J8H7_9GAMM|nr:hypothetical protein [Luteimonas salinisoli]NZA25423.1 hypothetical protein [Luteimonas salinisoli]